MSNNVPEGLPPLPPEIARAIKESNETQEVVILYNPATNQLQFKAPTNRVLAFGMLLMGVECLIAQSPLLQRGPKVVP